MWVWVCVCVCVCVLELVFVFGISFLPSLLHKLQTMFIFILLQQAGDIHEERVMR